jgi:hypothetical protein
VADDLKLPVGGTTVELHYVDVWTEPIGASAIDDNYGVLGMDALDELTSYTFDYKTMQFSVKTE